MANTVGTIRLGKIGFLNVLPVYYALEKGIVRHPFEILEASPSELNRMISRGYLGISAVSSLEYGYNYRKYMLFPDLSISSVGEVKSVVLFSDYSVCELDGREILLSSKSYTSVYLLRLLARRYWKVSPRYAEQRRTSNGLSPGRYSAVLAIGDDALKLAKKGAYRYRVDLGRAWYEWTGKPFVFAVWVINTDVVAGLNGHMKLAYNALMEAKKFGMEHIAEIASEASCGNILSYDECVEYFEQLRYDLTEEYLEGLDLFFEYLVECGMLPEKPHYRFYSAVQVK